MILLTWHSHRGGEQVLFQALKLLTEQDQRVDGVVYLIAKKSEDLTPEIQSKLSKHDPHKTIDFFVYPHENPTAHKAIYEWLRDDILGELLRKHGEKEWHINVSPGTPAMHACWLILYAAGELGQRATLWSTQLIKDENGSEQNIISKVDFQINTFLKELKHAEHTKQNPLLSYDVSKLSDARHRALQRIKTLVNLPNVPVLILGERGTGKSQFVKQIAKLEKKDSPFVEVISGALRDETGVSELLGYKKGAFTGAYQDKIGLIEAAKGGVLYLDEIQDISHALQRTLLQVLQEGTFRRVGETTQRESHFKLIASSNRTMNELRAVLDADFFDRISYLVAHVPPLRECREELLADWQRIWNHHSQRILAQSIPLPQSPRLNEVLREHPFPGNYRNLESLAYQLLASASETHLTLTAAQIDDVLDAWSSINPMDNRALAVASPNPDILVSNNGALEKALQATLGIAHYKPSFEGEAKLKTQADLFCGLLAIKAVEHYGNQVKVSEHHGVARQTLAKWISAAKKFVQHAK